MSKRPQLNYDIEDMIFEAHPEEVFTDQQLQKLAVDIINHVSDKIKEGVLKGLQEALE